MNTILTKFRAFQQASDAAGGQPSQRETHSDAPWFSGQVGAYFGFFLAVAVCMAAAFALSQHDVPLILGSLTNV